MNKCEYRLMPTDKMMRPEGYTASYGDLLHLFNMCGIDGWEFCGYIPGYIVFKRMLPATVVVGVLK